LTLIDSILLMEYRSLGSELLFLDEVEGAVPPLAALVFAILGFLLVAFAVGLVSMFVRWRRGDTIERLQIKWLGVAGVLLLTQAVLATFGVADSGVWNLATEIVLLMSLIALPFAIAVAVLRYRLFEIDRIISRTVTYGLVTGLLVLIYLGSVFVARLVLPVEGELAVAMSTLATVALFNPLRRRVKATVDRRFNRSRYDADRTLASFTGRLHDQIDLTDLTRDLHALVARTVQPSTISFWLRHR
jgi:cytochrome b subunit of formate dehydrogenase